jgi:hypothetical protein
MSLPIEMDSISQNRSESQTLDLMQVSISPDDRFSLNVAVNLFNVEL